MYCEVGVFILVDCGWWWYGVDFFRIVEIDLDEWVLFDEWVGLDVFCCEWCVY